MGACLENTTLTKSRIDNKPNIYMVESKKNSDKDINSNGSQSLLKSNVNKIEIENKIDKTEESNDNSLNINIFVKSQYILKKIFLHLGERKNYF